LITKIPIRQEASPIFGTNSALLSMPPSLQVVLPVLRAHSPQHKTSLSANQRTLRLLLWGLADSPGSKRHPHIASFLFLSSRRPPRYLLLFTLVKQACTVCGATNMLRSSCRFIRSTSTPDSSRPFRFLIVPVMHCSLVSSNDSAVDIKAYDGEKSCPEGYSIIWIY
jgi:hypothetical protein